MKVAPTPRGEALDFFLPKESIFLIHTLSHCNFFELQVAFLEAVKFNNRISPSSSAFPADSSPASSIVMGKPAVLLIGGVTHVKKEWEECSSFATLKVSSQ